MCPAKQPTSFFITLVLLCTLLTLFQSVSTTSTSEVLRIDVTGSRGFNTAYDELAPFSIAGDQNLTMKALAESWVGNGSLGNPIIIEGYNITLGGAFGNCIALYNISLYLVIQDCIIVDGDTGIYLENVTRFSSFRNIIHTNNIGIKFDDCDHSSVIATSFTENNFHLQFVDNANMNIEDCQFESSVSAIVGSQLFYSWIVNNTITNTDDGIVLGTACVGNVVRQNQFSKITIDGITLTNNAQLNKIVWNYFGGYMQGVTDNSIGLENELSHNYYFGFIASDVNNDGIYDYSFLVPGTAGVSDANPLIYPPLPPSWAQAPQNFEMELGSACFYELQIDSYPPIETWLVNDTLNFEIDQNGNLLDRGNLKLGKYSLEVTAIDLYGQSISGEFTVTVTDTTYPVFITPPANMGFYYGEVIDIQIIAWDLSGIDNWTINDTGNFTLTWESVGALNIATIESSHTLDPGYYPIHLVVYDASGLTVATSFAVTIETVPTGELSLVWILVPSGIAGTALIIVLVSLIRGRDSKYGS